jgi:hypothetical protein
MDYPSNGPLGSSLTLAGDLVADDTGQLHRPRPQPFPTITSPKKPDWLTQFVQTTTKPEGVKGGSCRYSKLPSAADCQIPLRGGRIPARVHGRDMTASPRIACRCSPPAAVPGEGGADSGSRAPP